MSAALPKNLEEEILQAKKVINHSKFAKNQSYKFIDWHIGNYRTRTSPPKDKSSKKEQNRFVNKNQYAKNTEVVVKITSNAKNYDGIAKHLSYMSRAGKLEILATDLHYVDEMYQDVITAQYQLQGKESLPFIHSFYKDKAANFSQDSSEQPAKRLTFNMVFSLKDYEGVDEFSFDPELVKKATFATMKQKFPNNFFSLVLHTDTNNPHCHICLKIEDKFGKRIDIRKADLFELREKFAKNLRKNGLEATATRRFERKRESDIAFSCHKEKMLPDFYPDFMREKDDPRFLPTKLGCFEVYDFGKAPYDFAEGNQQSYFVTYLTKDFKKVSIWGEDLERIVKENSLKKGDFAKFHKLGRATKMKNYQKIVKNNLYEVAEPAHYNKWDCIVYDQTTKTLSKERFDKLSRAEELKPSVKLINTMPKEHNARKPRRPDSAKHYTKDEWARYYRRRRSAKQPLQAAASLHQPKPNYDEGFARTALGGFDALRAMPESLVDFAGQGWQEGADLFLPSNTYPKLQLAESANDTPVRWAASSDSGARENLEIQTTKRIQELAHRSDNAANLKESGLEIE